MQIIYHPLWDDILYLVLLKDTLVTTATQHGWSDLNSTLWWMCPRIHLSIFYHHCILDRSPVHHMGDTEKTNRHINMDGQTHRQIDRSCFHPYPQPSSCPAIFAVTLVFLCTSWITPSTQFLSFHSKFCPHTIATLLAVGEDIKGRLQHTLKNNKDSRIIGAFWGFQVTILCSNKRQTALLSVYCDPSLRTEDEFRTFMCTRVCAYIAKCLVISLLKSSCTISLCHITRKSRER